MGQVVKKPDANVVHSDDYVALAIERNVAPEVLSKLIDNAARLDGIKNRKAFDAAMADAKAELPVIIKNREVSFGGGRSSYKFEDLAAIAKAVDPILAKFGLSYRFRTGTQDDGKVVVTCIVSHRDGHSEENSLPSSPDTSGSKNAIQAIGSAVTYLQRYTLKAALGLAASADDDGNAGQAEVASGAISPAQVKTLTDKLEKRGMEQSRLIRWVKHRSPDVSSIEQIPAARFQQCIDQIEAAK